MKLKEIHETVKHNLYSVIPTSVLLDVNLGDGEKILYCHIIATMDYMGRCTENNFYFSTVTGKSVRTVQDNIANLIERGYLTRIEHPNIRILGMPTTYVSFIQPPKTKNDKLNADTELVEWMDSFVELWQTKMKLKRTLRKDVYYSDLLDRLDSFSREDLIKALNNRIKFVSTSDWHQEPENQRHTNNLGILIREDKSVLQYLTMELDDEPDRDKNLKKDTVKFNIDKKNLLD